MLSTLAALMSGGGSSLVTPEITSTTVILIDRSGSMSSRSILEGKDIGEDILGTVCRTVNTLCSVLTPAQHVSIVTFDSVIELILDMSPMNDSNKGIIKQKLQISPRGCTETWKGLEYSLQKLYSMYHTYGEKIKYNIILFTDGTASSAPTNRAGEPITHPNGFSIALGEYKQFFDGFLPKIFTFGFGSNVNADMLARQIAGSSDGVFGNISTPDMITTNIVNAAAFILANEAPVTLSAVDEEWRIKLIKGLNQIYEYILQDNLHKACAINRSLSEGMRTAGANSLMIKDVEEQIAISISRKEYATTWGIPFIMCLISSHQQKYCCNFKNPSLQMYAGPEFTRQQKLIEKTVKEHLAQLQVAITAQHVASGNTTAPAASAAALFDPAGGCWTQEAKVRMADKSKLPIKIKDLKRGDMVWTPHGPAAVLFLVKLTCQTNPMKRMCRIGNNPANALISSHHPVFNKYDNKWNFPKDIWPCERVLQPTVYNVLLNSKHIISVDDIESPTLGHGLTGPVIEHDFFGNYSVIMRTLMKHPYYASSSGDSTSGLIEYNNLEIIRDPETGLVCDWIENI